jgi:hypothetical protein
MLLILISALFPVTGVCTGAPVVTTLMIGVSSRIKEWKRFQRIISTKVIATQQEVEMNIDQRYYLL